MREYLRDNKIESGTHTIKDLVVEKKTAYSDVHTKNKN